MSTHIWYNAFMTNEEIMDAVRERMREKGMSQAEVAELIGRYQSNIADMLAGRRGQVPSLLLETLEQLGLELVVRPKEVIRLESDTMTVPWWMVVSAVRYSCGRQSYIVSDTADWLITNWERLPEEARHTIQRDLEGEFRRDDVLRPEGRYAPLGADMDRRQWERVRALWAEEGEG